MFVLFVIQIPVGPITLGEKTVLNAYLEVTMATVTLKVYVANDIFSSSIKTSSPTSETETLTKIKKFTQTSSI